ncbi:glucose-6-phosphate dehydrogenase [Micromonospora sp. NPDC005197]|uniref:glucose-6-phosphate dehydrogenase n=1 Tax=unclassified Micromonospora TaxID=2617518 RepID=UPI0033AC689D
MARPELPIGTWGKIRTQKLGPNRFRARARFRDYDGKTRDIETTDTTGPAAERALKVKLRDRTTSNDDEITRETRVSTLADLWIEEITTEEPIFQPIWDRSWVDHVQITVAETLGVGGRGGFYEDAGAMRDIVQNHVLQVLALALMEPPASFEAEGLRNEKVKLLQAIRLPTDRDIAEAAVRGQYTRGGTREELMAGYREEAGVDPLSRTETYTAMRLNVDNWRWAGVPFYVRTGKRLPARLTEVALQFQRPPHLPIPTNQLAGLDADALILRIQPNEGISLRFGAKVPGHSFRVRTATMEFSYDQTFAEESPEAYERLLLDALIGDASLFIRSDEVQQCWRIVDPIIDNWEKDHSPIPTYEAASWGPTDADRLIGRHGRKWRNSA